MAKVVSFFFIAIAAPVFGQVIDITSELDAVGRNFSCIGEVVTYTCSGQGSTLSVNAPPLFNQHAFGGIDTVPGTQLFLSAPNVVLTLLTRKSSNYSANLQITMLSDAQLRINVSCSTNNPGPLDNFVIPLIRESQIMSPSTVTMVGLTGDTTRRSVRVAWIPPVNPQFDIEYYLVNIYMNGVLYTTRRSSDNSLDADVPSGEITADVRTVSTCGTMSNIAERSNGSVFGQYSAFYVGFLFPTFIGFLLITAVVVLAIFLVRANKTISKLQQVQDDEKGVVLEPHRQSSQ
ncbi:uncharacterized protein LOC135347763 [Halichondria panicea]|uniref:uncharacterized protein LOC135347763 n=1 Tax=Halichondria panicea TaxID=6063 RepID=UPI00312B471F